MTKKEIVDRLVRDYISSKKDLDNYMKYLGVDWTNSLYWNDSHSSRGWEQEHRYIENAGYEKGTMMQIESTLRMLGYEIITLKNGKIKAKKLSAEKKVNGRS